MADFHLVSEREFDLLMCVLDAFEGDDPALHMDTIDTILCNLIDAGLVNAVAGPAVFQSWRTPGIGTRNDLKRLYMEKVA